jgi:hypothetical protein
MFDGVVERWRAPPPPPPPPPPASRRLGDESLGFLPFGGEDLAAGCGSRLRSRLFERGATSAINVGGYR